MTNREDAMEADVTDLDPRRLEMDRLDIHSGEVEFFLLDPAAQWFDAAGHAHRNVPRTYVERPSGRFNSKGDEYRDPFCPLCGEQLQVPVKRAEKPSRVPLEATVTYVDGSVFALTEEQISDLMKINVVPDGVMATLAARWRIELEAPL